MEINIGSIRICPNSIPVVVPEIGINHEGDLKTAFEMVDSAKRAGAKLIKHQTHVIDDEMSGAAKNVIPGNAKVSIYEIMKRCALSEDQEFELKKYIESQGMLFFSTPFSRAAALRLEKMDVKLYKIGSGEMNNYPLLDLIASFGKPIILSTGMNDITAIKKAVEILDKRNVSYALLHTTNLYPTPARLVRFGAMQQLIQEFRGVPVGLSDHTVNNNACIAAIALGASIVERHFTDKMNRSGPDIACSMDEQALKELIAAAEEISLMFGGEKCAAFEEKVTIDFAFATIVAIEKIKKGDKLTEKNIWVKRPGIKGILAADYQKVLGRFAAEDIENDTHIEYNMLKD